MGPRLERRIRQLRSDPNAIEQIAREELKMAKPGDVIYTLPPAPKESGPASPPEK